MLLYRMLFGRFLWKRGLKIDDYVSKDTRKLKLRDPTDEESKIYNDRLESEAIDTAIVGNSYDNPELLSDESECV